MNRKSFIIVKKITVVMLLFAILLSGFRMPIQVKADVDTIGELFKQPSTIYNNDLALFAADLCDKAQGSSSDKVEKFLENNGFKKEPYNYNKDKKVKYDLISESASFVIGHKKVNIEGEGNATVLVVVVRGSTTLAEFIGDAAKESKVKKMLKKGKSIIDSLMASKSWKKFVNEFDNAGKYRILGQEVYHNIYDFEEKVWEGLDKYFNANPDIEKDKNLKILVTGHSLGGATANLIAARMDYLRNRGEWVGTAKKDNIYCYTFGAIKVLTKNINIKDKYENIFNIYNKYDSFGPNGNLEFTKASHPKAKFGITLEYVKLKAKEDLISWNNHDMGGNYKIAIKKGFVKEFFSTACAGREFKIEGKWRNVGDDTFGQVQSRTVVVFNGEKCAIYSPFDTYAFYKEDNQWYLDCTSFLFKDTVSFKVKVINNDNIELNYGSTKLKLKRVN